MYGSPVDAADGPARRRARPRGPHHRQQPGRRLPARPSEPAVPRTAPERALAVGLHLRRDLAGLRLRGLRHRRHRPWPIPRRDVGKADRARWIVGWRVSRTAHASFVLDALEQALHERRPVQGSGLVHHSDRESSTSRSATPSASPMRASSPRSAASATATTTPWPRRSTASTRPRSSGAGDPGARWRRLSSPPSTGWIGSTTAACSSPSATSLPPKPKRATINRSRPSPWQRDSTKSASGKPGAVQPSAARPLPFGPMTTPPRSSNRLGTATARAGTLPGQPRAGQGRARRWSWPGSREKGFSWLRAASMIRSAPQRGEGSCAAPDRGRLSLPWVFSPVSPA